MNPLANSIRAIVTGLIGILVGAGIVPVSIQNFIEANADVVVGFVLVVWSGIALYRNNHDKKRKV